MAHRILTYCAVALLLTLAAGLIYVKWFEKPTDSWLTEFANAAVETALQPDKSAAQPQVVQKPVAAVDTSDSAAQKGLSGVFGSAPPDSPEPVRRTWDEVEAILEGLRQERATRPAAMHELHDWYELLASPNFTRAEDYLQHFQNLKSWAKSHPGSVTQRVVVAKAYIQWAWEARGSGYAFTVGEEGWELFHGRLTEARRLLDEVVKLGPKDGEAYNLLIQLGKAEGLSEPEVRAYVNAGQKLDPGYAWMYAAMAEYLLPRWHGEPGDVERFAAEMARAMPGDDGLDAFGHIAFVRHMYEPDMIFWGQYDRKLLGESAAVLAKRYPQADRMVNFAAYAAYAAQDQEAARAILPLVQQYDPEVHIWPWENTHRTFLQWTATADQPTGEKNWVWGARRGCMGTCFSADSENLWSAEQAGTAVGYLDIVTGQKVLEVPGPGSVLNEAAFDPERGWILAAFWREPFTGWILYDTEGEYSATRQTSEQIRAVAIDPIRPRIAWAEGKTVHILDLDTQAELPPRELREHVHGLCFSSDGSLLLVDSSPHCVLDAETGSEKYALLDRNAKPVPEWQILSSLAIDEEQRVWATLHSGRHQSNCLARFAPDGKTWEVLLNDLPKGRASLSTKRDRLAVFKDNMTNYGGTVEIWDVASARKLTELPGHWDRISEMVFSADGKKLATVGMRTGIIKIWNLDEAAEK